MASGGDFDPYGELGLERGCDQDEVRRAYRRRVSACHPDKGGDREEFERVQRAYDVLGDPDKRRAHDAGEPYFDESEARLDREVTTNLVRSVVELACHFEDTRSIFFELVRVGLAAESRLRGERVIVSKVRARVERALEALVTPDGSVAPDPVRNGLRARLREISLAEKQARWNLRLSAETLRRAQLYHMDPSKFSQASLTPPANYANYQTVFFTWDDQP